MIMDIAPGVRIPGSRYYRQYCLGCNDAIRSPRASTDGHWCDDCAGVQHVRKTRQELWPPHLVEAHARMFGQGMDSRQMSK